MCVQYHLVGGTLDRRFRFFFFTRNDFFLKLVDEHQSGGTQHTNSPRLLLWQEWGIDNTRFMPYGMQPRWLRLVPCFMSSQVIGFFVPLVSKLLARESLLTKHGPFPCGRYVHGLKVVCPPYPSDQNKWGCVLQVFDFNVHPKKLPEADDVTRSFNLAQATGRGMDTDHGRADDSSSATPGSSSSSSSSPLSTRPSTPSSSSIITHEVSHTIHTEPSSVAVPEVFVSDVVSKLPYTHTVRKDLCTVYSGFMIDDERIVGLKVGAVFFLGCASSGERPLCLQASPDGEMGDIDVFVF